MSSVSLRAISLAVLRRTSVARDRNHSITEDLILPRSALAAACVCAAALAVLIPQAAVASSDSGAAATSSQPTAGQTATLTPAELTLLDSSAPQTILMDPETGDILSVSPASASSPDIENHGICNTGDGCFFTNEAPYADEGFYDGAGTYHGTWQERSGYSSGKWTASACWTTRCGPKLSTGTSFTIY
jgi:hypothetical protein